MKPFDTGLVVGKFCPLHRGHELVIDTAAAQCESVVVISYTKPEFVGAEPHRRERWLRRRYPTATVLVLDDERLTQHCLACGLPPRALPDNAADDDVHRQFVAWLCTALLRQTVDAVFTSEAYGPGFAQALAASFGHPVRHVSVDPARRVIAASGTAVRGDVHGLRHLLAPQVYADFVQRCCFLGGESSGKSTMAQLVADAIGSVCVPEFGRTWWEHRGGALTFDDMLLIAREQVEAEGRLAPMAHAWLCCDTTPLTTLFYSRELFDRADAELTRLAERKYDAVFLCAPDFPFVQDGTRQGAAFRARQHAWYFGELARRRVPYVELTGSVGQRLSKVLQTIGADTGVRTADELNEEKR